VSALKYLQFWFEIIIIIVICVIVIIDWLVECKSYAHRNRRSRMAKSHMHIF